MNDGYRIYETPIEVENSLFFGYRLEKIVKVADGKEEVIYDSMELHKTNIHEVEKLKTILNK